MRFIPFLLVTAFCGLNSLADGQSSTTAKRTGEDWPCWRGPRGDGISRETNWSYRWSDAPPKTLWKAQVGTGFSSFSVAQGRLFTMGHSQGKDTVFCLDALTGRERWSHTYPCELVDNLHEGGPACTPTVDADRVYTVSKEGHLFCFSAADGAIRWQLELQPLLDVTMPEWGFSCSPLVVGELLILEAGRTVALDKLTGKEIWRTERFAPGYGSPALWKLGARQLIATLNNECLLVTDLKTGKVLDKASWTTSFKTSSITPIVSGDTVFISTGYNRGCALWTLNGETLEQEYENKSMSNHMNNCVLWKGHLYGFDGNSHNARQVRVACIEYSTGKSKWRERGLGCGSLLLAGNKLLLLSDEGELVVAQPSPDQFEPLARVQILSGKCWTVPVLSHGLIYCRNAAGDVACVDVRK